LKVDLGDLELALQAQHDGLTYYLHVETRELILVTDELAGPRDGTDDGIRNEEGECTISLETYVEGLDIYGWMKEELLKADPIRQG
jgi:hypothetical protein